MSLLNEDKRKKFKDNLLESLDDPTVQKRILSIISGDHGLNMRENTKPQMDTVYEEKIRALNKQLEQLKAELSQSRSVSDTQKSEISQLNGKINKHTAAISTLTAQRAQLELERDSALQNEKLAKEECSVLKLKYEDVSWELSQMKEQFQMSVQLYHQYLKVDDIMRARLANIISDKSCITFIASCSQYTNLEALWDYIKTLIMNQMESYDFISLLTQIFEYYFELYNTSSGKLAYHVNSVEIGDRFDDDLHIRGRESKAQGNITTVLLRGYSSANTRKVIRKSVVIAG